MPVLGQLGLRKKCWFLNNPGFGRYADSRAIIHINDLADVITMARLRNLIESQQLTHDIIADIFTRADHYKATNERNDDLKGKILLTLFYEPSTRTRLSFESAMHHLGGSVLSTENAAEFSSSVKGESLEDTLRVVSAYADCIAMRHKEDCAAARAAAVTDVPIINAGDGKGQHPTQALLDLYTIKDELGRTENLRVTLVGDLLNGRTVRSLCYLLGKFEGITFNFVSPANLQMRPDIKQYLSRKSVAYNEYEDMRPALANTDVLYLTRVQKERMTPEEYERTKGACVFTPDCLASLPKESRVLHPLPKVDEVQLPVDVEQRDRRIAYFRQAANGLYVRMALLHHLLA